MKWLHQIIARIKDIRKISMPSYNSTYTLDSKPLGSGGAAVVYGCTRISDGERFAIKMLNEREIKDKVERFIREIDAMQDLANNGIGGILPIVDSNREELWYVMPLAQSVRKTIEDLSNQQQTACPATTYKDTILDGIDGFIQLAETLYQIHALGYVHRDIKPDNIYIYDGRWCLGDFGIVDLPDGVAKSLTKKHDHLGAWNTIAPEVLRDARLSTAKADVYSLAKTMWMWLALNLEGFDGRYDRDTSSMSLHDAPHLEHAYLLDIDELLYVATEEDPNNRPSMHEFADRLKEWKKACSDFELMNRKEWDFVYKSLFNNMRPSLMSLENRDDIVRALNLLSRYTHLNYTMLPRRGGLTLKGASIAPEEGCIYLDFGLTYICKPKRLVFRGFNDVSWNYFYLELSELTSVLTQHIEEELIEDIPGHYVDATYVNHRVYDYESGKPLPKGWKHVMRVCKGAFLVVSKGGFYNSITPTDDGRHEHFSEEGFFGYMTRIKKDVVYCTRDGISLDVVRRKYWYNPFPEPEVHFESNDETGPDDFITTRLDTLCFSDLLDDTGDGYANYAFVFNTVEGHSIFNEFKYRYLCKDGKVGELAGDDPQIFHAHDKEVALRMSQLIEQRMEQICEANGFKKSSLDAYVSIKVSMRKVPDHIFTYKELKDAIMNADDRLDNTICIDEKGHVVAVSDYDYHVYPVSYSTFGALGNYVGPYSHGTEDNIIKDLRSLFFYYLKTGRAARNMEFDDDRDVKTIVFETKQLLEDYKSGRKIPPCR
ncbi:MAG: protein kinase [Candidatus Cryptobacteroides sp.]|nr:protein kinase [Candidatus Cryptobacteroides sp.]